MTKTTPFTIGTGVSCSDGACGKVTRVVVDPVRRGEHVHATDGHIGKVQGLVIDPKSHRVTHVLLQEGHLWGRKEVAIPISAVRGVGDGIRLPERVDSGA